MQGYRFHFPCPTASEQGLQHVQPDPGHSRRWLCYRVNGERPLAHWQQSQLDVPDHIPKSPLLQRLAGHEHMPTLPEVGFAPRSLEASEKRIDGRTRQGGSTAIGFISLVPDLWAPTSHTNAA
jgi:hypothetical protein